MIRSSLSILLLVSLSPMAWAQFDSDPFNAAFDQPVLLDLLLDCEAVSPGDSFRVAVVIDIEDDWHVYANPKGPGTGKATVVIGADQEGFEFKPALYLPGHKVSQEEIAPGDWVFAYKEATPVFLEVQTDETLAPGNYDLTISAEILACKESCEPFDETLNLKVRVLEKGQETIKREDSIFERFDEAKPAPVDNAKIDDNNKPSESKSSIGPAVDFSVYQSRELETGQGIGDLWMAILFGFIAGMLLNIMPCVLPVISIKIMSLVSQAHESRGRILGLGLAFSAGILIVFLVLAGFAASVGMSWGEHFQSETFIVVMLSLVFVFALGMFDVYLIIVPGGSGGHSVKEGYLGSFLKGVLATFLATPCSGPFLGATLAWALSQTPAVIFLVFMSIGVGMAFPYVVLTAMPGLLKFVPKPGAWMQTFKQIMGFILLGTVVYLFTILRHELVGPTLTYCLILGFGAFLWGKYAHVGIPVTPRWIWRIALLLVAAGGAFLCFSPSEHEEIAWEPFSMETLQAYASQNRNIMVDFTADWCPNCKFVEKTRLESDEVRAALAEKNVVPLLADITRSGPDDPMILFRNQLGSRSIPFLAIFPADAPNEPYILRDIYSIEDVLSILDRCPDSP